MKRSKFSEQQIFAILKEAEVGATVKDVCRRHGLSPATFHQWKSKYGGLETAPQASHSRRHPGRT